MRRAMLAMLLTAGCGPQPVTLEDVSIASAERAMAEAGHSARFQPGRWESQLRVVDMTLAGASPELAEALRGAARSTALSPVCVAADRPPPLTEAVIPAEVRRDCGFKRFSATGERLDALLLCHGWRGPRALSFELSGRFAGDRLTLASTARTQPSIGTKLSIATEITMRRTGPCLGDESQGGTG